jgi:GNAT superfamily N-acetyltransferase
MQSIPLHIGSKILTIRRAEVAQIVALRHRILRAGLPIEEAHFSGDAEMTTRHVAAFDESDAVGCATFVLNSWENEPAWQLRGMATDIGWQSRGVGEAVLRYAIDLALEAAPVRLFWCNARIGALNFYLRQGWEIQSEIFDIPTAGLHRKMKRR